MKKNLLLFIVFMLATTIFAESKKAYVSPANKVKLKKLAEKYAKEWQKKHDEALIKAKNLGIPTKIFDENNQLIMELQYIGDDNIPQYYTIDNVNAAKTISTDDVQSGGSMGLSLTGNGFQVREWDGGGVRSTHQEYSGRISNGDGISGTHYHSTHVAGTMVASGVDPNAKGMATAATLKYFDWNSDTSEMTTEASAGMLLSNHSYGYTRGWYWDTGSSSWQWNGGSTYAEDPYFGFYDSNSEDFDRVMYNAPNYLIVKAAGNDRGDGPGSPDNGHPEDGPYDCLDQLAVAKNPLVVAAVEDLPNGYHSPSDVVITSFSSFGPCDDGRIKPDIAANGSNLYSTYDNSDTAYDTISGTSMATPSVTGSLILVQEHYEDVHGSGNYLRGSTLKALAIHCADEAGSYPGPDYQFGWGLMNTKRMIEYIDNDGDTDQIQELTLTNGGSYSTTVTSNGVDPLKVTIAWTDAPGNPVSITLDPPNPMLINDLDLRITRNSNTYYPWKLDKDNPSAPATNSGDNAIDNVEQVYIENPEAASYTITVTHKGTLVDDSGSTTSQQFAMIISGIDNNHPDCKITQPGDRGFALKNSTQTIKTNATDISKSVSQVEFYIDDTLVNTDTSSPFEYAWDTSSYSLGDHEIKIIATDNVSYTDIDSVNITLVNNVINSFPYTQNFDSSSSLPTDWAQVSYDDFDWSVTSGATPSSGTGPSSDHTTGSDNYAFTESSSPNDLDKKAFLLSPCFDLSGGTPQLSFYYHMYSDTDDMMGTFEVDIYADNQWHNGIFSKTEDQGNSWHQATIDLTDYSSDMARIRFRVITYGWKSDVAIDDFEMDIQAPIFSLSPTSLAFGDVEVGNSLTKQFTITNTGSGTLTGNITTPTGYSVAPAKSAKGTKVEPKNTISYSITSSQTFDLTFSPTSTTTYNDDVTITSNDSTHPNNTLAVTGKGIQAVISLSKTSLAETMPTNKTATQNLSISNTGDADLNYTATIQYSKSSKNVILSEDFENGGSIPSGWTTQYISGDNVDWQFVAGNGSSNPNSAHGGSYNALLKDSDSDDDKTMLISPKIDFGSDTNNTQLTFWHYMEEWPPDQDELRVYYKTSSGDSWHLLQEYTSSVTSWTQRVLSLPNPSSDYYIAFEGNAKYGYGVCIDDVLVEGDPGYSWLKINGGNSDSDTVSPSGTDNLTIGFDSSGLSTGTYNATISITSNDPNSPDNVSVTLTVDNSVDATADAGGNNGDTGAGAATADVPPVNIDGDTVDPDISIDPDGNIPISVDVTVSDTPVHSVSNPSNVVISYDLDISGATSGVVLSCVFDFTGLSSTPSYIHWLNGSTWEVPNNVSWGSNNVSFEITFNSKGETTEVILSDNNPLPVSLSQFTSAYLNGNAILTWVTQSEEDNAFWNVYKSNSNNFGQAVKLNQTNIEGNGTSTTEHKYIFVDETQFEEGLTYYYWLESISYSGENTLFGPVELVIEENNDNSDAPDFIVYGLRQNNPNPFNPVTNISFILKKNSHNTYLEIFNLKGEKVKTLLNGKYIEANKLVNIAWNGKDDKGKKVPSGIYLYKLKTDVKQTVKKMLLLK